VPPNVGVDAAARIHSSFILPPSSLHFTLPPLAYPIYWGGAQRRL